MNDTVFQFKSRPFSTYVGVEQYVPTACCETAIGLARSAIERHAGPCLVLGSAGSGKTMVLDRLADNFAGQYQIVSYACVRTDSRIDIFQSMLFQLGQNYKCLTESELRLELADYLRPGPHCPNGILLLVDDAHCLSPLMLDELRLLSGMVRGGQSRCNLVLAGTQRLEETLCDPALESFNQRLMTRCYLHPLARSETEAYIRESLRLAGGGSHEIFTLEAINHVQRVTQGIPRLINQLCDAALITSSQLGSLPIDKATIGRCWADLQRIPEEAAAVHGVTEFPQQVSQSAVVEFGVLASEEDGPTATFSPPVRQHTRPIDRDCTGVQASTSHQSVKELMSDAMSAASMDLDPDQVSLEPIPLPSDSTSPATSSPFDESFDTEELVADVQIQISIGHNSSAAQLTRTDLDHFAIDSVPTAPTLMSTSATATSVATTNAVTERAELKPTVPFGWSRMRGPAADTPKTASTDAEAADNDDRTLLQVSRANQMNIAAAETESCVETKSCDVSTGRAIRMNYNQLFQRLRQDPAALAGR